MFGHACRTSNLGLSEVKIKDVAYLGSFGPSEPLPRERGPEIVFLGRSNVGKSSLINALVGKRNLARTSNTPGKTRTANYYRVNDEFCFVDMPGYGYAKVSKAERAQWRKLIALYIAERKTLAGVVHLLDVRHTPSDSDREWTSAVRTAGRRLCLAFNKVDKIRRGDVDRTIAGHLQRVTVHADTAVVPFSIKTGVGRRQLWAWIQDSLSLCSDS